MTEQHQGKFRVAEISQVCIVVRDLQKTMEHYWNTLGIGPWSIYDAGPPFLRGTTYHGKPSQLRMKVASAMVGSLYVELIQPLEGDSIYSDFLKEHGEGLHHLGLFMENIDEMVRAMENAGFPCIASGHTNGNAFAYFDAVKTLGVILEGVEMSGGMPPPEAVWPADIPITNAPGNV